jgi:hypothetical protein
MTDTLILECPKCKNQFPVSTYLGDREGKVFGIEYAPLIILAEVNRESREDRIQCIHCSTSLYVEVVYAAKVRTLSMRNREGWNHS